MSFKTPHIITTFITLSAVAGLTACGGSETNETTSPTRSAVESAPEARPIQAAAKTLSPLERGARVYKKCKSCHSLEQGGRHKVGPNMWAVYGATAGTKEGFAYSKVMKESAIIWTDETLDAYIANPRKYMPGNRMSYVGLRKAEDRADVLAYIKAETTPK